MTAQCLPRECRPNEVGVIVSKSGMAIAAICRRDDGFFCFAIDFLEYVDRAESYFWQSGSMNAGIYGNIADAEREALVELGATEINLTLGSIRP